ncbi:hypothetical protein A7J57_08585 [Agrobacterium tumefaciens]|uniref:Uncharacterized protein n=2 Tax=Agrobacterium tumefaciens TaxID=358 RepID=A0A176WW63_AGRTU|nr:hypothetical protein A7J57_08585 [Agrobacterium tumefaciens]
MDPFHANFSEFITSAVTLKFYTSNLSRFLSIHSHANDFVKRAYDENKSTHLVVTGLVENGEWVPLDADRYSLAQLRNALDNGVDCRKYILSGVKDSFNLPDFIMIADDTLIASIPYPVSLNYPSEFKFALLWDRHKSRLNGNYEMAFSLTNVKELGFPLIEVGTES